MVAMREKSITCSFQKTRRLLFAKTAEITTKLGRFFIQRSPVAERNEAERNGFSLERFYLSQPLNRSYIVHLNGHRT